MPNADLTIKSLNHQLPPDNLLQVGEKPKNTYTNPKRRIIKGRPSIPKSRLLFEVDITKWKSKVHKKEMAAIPWDEYLEELNELVDILEVESSASHEKENVPTLLK